MNAIICNTDAKVLTATAAYWPAIYFIVSGLWSSIIDSNLFNNILVSCGPGNWFNRIKKSEEEVRRLAMIYR